MDYHGYEKDSVELNWIKSPAISVGYTRYKQTKSENRAVEIGRGDDGATQRSIEAKFNY